MNSWDVEESYVEMHLPLVQNWAAKALVTYELLWIPIQDTLRLELNNVTASLQVKLLASSYGRLRPTLQKIKVDFGTSAIMS